jgi:hypothetical protein
MGVNGRGSMVNRQFLNSKPDRFGNNSPACIRFGQNYNEFLASVTGGQIGRSLATGRYGMRNGD